MPRVFNRHHGNVPPGAVYVGRPSKFGNPWSHLDDVPAGSEFRCGTREEAVSRYEEWLSGDPDMLRQVRLELGGRDLVCSCVPHACHASVLLAAANASDPWGPGLEDPGEEVDD